MKAFRAFLCGLFPFSILIAIPPILLGDIVRIASSICLMFLIGAEISMLTLLIRKDGRIETLIKERTALNEELAPYRRREWELNIAKLERENKIGKWAETDD